MIPNQTCAIAIISITLISYVLLTKIFLTAKRYRNVIKELKIDLSVEKSNTEFYRDMLISNTMLSIFDNILSKDSFDIFKTITDSIVFTKEKLQTLPKKDLNNLLKHFTESEEYEKAELIKKELERREK